MQVEANHTSFESSYNLRTNNADGQIALDYVSSNRGQLNFKVDNDIASSMSTLMSLLHTGDVEFPAANQKISGSSTSTGSFGRVEVVDKIARTGDPDTHIYFSDDDINIQVGGVNFIDLTQNDGSQDEITFNEAGADLDFRVEGDTDQNLLFVDAGNDKIGVGTKTSLTSLLTVDGDITATHITASGDIKGGNLFITSSGESVVQIGNNGETLNKFELHRNGERKWVFYNDGRTDGFAGQDS